MSGADASAAAAAYLARLPAVQLHAANALDAAHHWNPFLGGLLAMFAALIVLRAGWLSKLRARIEAGRPRPWLATAACALVLGLAIGGTLAIWSCVAAWREARMIHGPSVGLWRGMWEAARGEAPMLLAGVVVVSLFYGLTRLLPRLWWIVAGTAATVFFFSTVWAPDSLSPGKTDMASVPPGAARDAVAALVRDTRLPADGIYVSPAPGFDTDVIGDGRHARISVTRALLTEPPAEIRAAVGHVMGHHAHGDMRTFAILLSLLSYGGFLTAAMLFHGVSRLTGARRGAVISDPDAMPVLAMIAIAWFALSTLAVNNFIRTINVGADQYSLDHAREPDGLALWLVRDWRGDRPDPSRLDELIFYGHPSMQGRLIHAMQWKATHTKPPPARSAPRAIKASQATISGSAG